MESQDKFNRGSTKGAKCKSIYNDIKGRRSFQSVARQTTKGWIDSGIEIKICSTMFLHSKEGWFTMVSSRLQEAKSSYHQKQNTTSANRRSY